jgi:hypothetical protein
MRRGGWKWTEGRRCRRLFWMYYKGGKDLIPGWNAPRRQARRTWPPPRSPFQLRRQAGAVISRCTRERSDHVSPTVDREPLDAPAVWADPPAHRATHVVSDLIERTAHGGSETRGGAIPAGVPLRAVLRGGISGEERAAMPKRDSCHRFRMGGTAGCRVCGSLSGTGGRRNGCISEIPVEG